jgi:DNA mismatch repair ATPase MutL
LKVPKTKTTNNNFLYAPKAGAGSIKDAALEIFGNNCTSQCSWHVLQSHGFELQAFCPNPEAASQKISNIGQFVFVDSRLMNCTRGTSKQVVSVFRGKLRKGIKDSVSVKDPFLYLNVICPKASYDLNVEPGKADVLFDDSSKLITAVTELFTAVYPICQDEPKAEAIPPTASIGKTASLEQSIPQQMSAESLAPVTPSVLTLEDNSEEVTVLDDEELSCLIKGPQTPAWTPTMYGCDKEDLELLADIDTRSANGDVEDPREIVREVNPWTIAKMNTPLRQNNTSKDSSLIKIVQQPLVDEVERSSSTLATPIHDLEHISILRGRG